MMHQVMSRQIYMLESFIKYFYPVINKKLADYKIG
jgi:hypothetical protein